ncbi:MAG: surface-adhesin E family protein [Burkholderiales bacterium]|jgi:hypothetical protein|tara:strand:- start:790 stop:1194 length:405 start_codon:yes stop_codon:yes gene_type:complete
MRLNYLILIILLSPFFATAETWVDVGADTEAKYYVDLDSIKVDGVNMNVIKKGVYTNVMGEKLDGEKLVVFKITMARLELDCARELNRVTQIDMLSESDEVVWSSGYMSGRVWLSIKDQGHARTTYDLICAQAR